MPATPAFRNSMVQRLLGPNPMSIRALARETGIAQSTLWRWRLDALRDPSSTETPVPTEAPFQKPQSLSPEQKFQLLLQASVLPQDQLGSFLRSHGLHEAQLQTWRHEAIQGLLPARPEPNQTTEIRNLQAELQRKEQALAEAAALLLLQKKTSWLLADVESTSHKKTARKSSNR